ncbi:T9SS type A sorting domain-containing protein, partial [Flavobacterium cellulosilyticum]
ATQTICSGTNASFSIIATGTGLTYQWRKGTTNLSNTGNITGATTATLNLSNVATSDAGSYNVIVSGASPCSSVTSNAATLLVNQAVAISTQPISTQTLCAGNSVSFSTTATGTGLTYQWRKGTTVLTNTGNISGANTTTLTINPVVSADAASDYNVVITGTAPCTAVTSNNAALVIIDAVVITSQPAATQSICSDTNASLSVTATGTGLTYQWRKGTTNLSDGGNISGANTSILTLTNIAIADAGSYNVIISGTNPCPPVTSSNAVLTVNKKVVIGTQPSNVGICASSPAQLGVVASGDGLSYQWFKYKGTSPITTVTNNAFITGAQTNILNFSQAYLPDDGIYYVVISGSSPCTFVKSNEVTLNVDQSIVVTTQPVSQSLCVGSNVSFTVAADANGDPLSYQWRKNGINISGQNNATLSLNTISSGDGGNYDVVISGPVGYTCSLVTSTAAVLTVNPLPTATAGGTQTICSNGTATVNGANATFGSILWSHNGAGSITAGSTISTPTYTATTGDAGKTVTLTMTVTSNNACSSQIATATYSIIVNALPTATAGGSQTICSNGTATVSGATSTNGTILWTHNGAGSITSGSSTLTPTYISAAGDASKTVTLTMTVTSTIGCTPAITATATYSVMVNPLPTATAGGTQTICSNGTATVSGATSTNGSILWTHNGAGSITAGSTTLTPTYTAAAGDAGKTVILTMTVTSTISCTPAITATATYSVMVNPLPTATAGGSQTICSNGTATVNGATSTNGTILWTHNGAGSITAGSTTLTPTYTAAAGDAAKTVTLTMTVTSTIGCIPAITATATYSIIVNPLPTATAGGTQTICSNGTATVSGASSTNGTILWTHNGSGSITVGSTTLTPTYTAAAGDAGKTVILTMTVTSTIGCTPAITATATYSVIVNPLPTAAAGGSQTICSNGTATVSGATSTNGTILWTHNGAGSITAGSNTLTPTYTAAAGDASKTVTLTMTVTSTIGCTPAITATATYSVIVNPLPTAAAGGTQTICSNGTATVSGASSTNGTILWTHNGAGSITAGSTTLTPTYAAAAGDAGKTVTLTMTVTSTNGCTPAITAIATYSVIVNPLPTATAGGSQTICSNSSATVSGASSTNGTILWTHNGVGSITAGSTTLTPTYAAAAGDASKTVTLTMTVTSSIGCTPALKATATYSIIVNSLPTATAGGSQTICSNGTATVSGASSTNGTILWTHNGAGSISTGSTTLTPTYTAAAGDAGKTVILTMTVTSTIGCTPIIKATATYSIIVNPLPTAAAGGSQTICSNGTATVSGASSTNGTILWTHNGAGSITAGNTTLTPTYTAAAADASKTVTLTMTVTSTIGCTPAITATASYSVTVDATSVGGAVNLTQTKDSNGNFIPLSTPTNTYTDCHNSSGILVLSGQTGAVLRWESSINAGSTWTNLFNAGNTSYTYAPIANNTIFRAVVQNANCSIVNSATTIVFIIPNIKPNPVSATPSTICEGDSSTLFSGASFSSSQNLLDGGLFNNANPPGWLVDGNGVFSASGDNENSNTWKETNGNAGDEYNTTSGDKFAIVRGNRNSTMQTPIFDLLGLTSAFLTFDYAYKLSTGAWGKVELSLDGGVTYPVTLANYSGNKGPYNQYNSAMSLDLNPYLGYTNLRIRFNYNGLLDKASGIAGDAWVVDNIKIPQAPIPNITSVWEDLNTHSIISISNTTNVVVSPAISTTYAVTSYLNGCTSYGPEGTTYVTVTVNKRPTANIGIDQLICHGGSASLSITLTGKAPWVITYSNTVTGSTTVTTSTNPYNFSVSGITSNRVYTLTNLRDANCNAALPAALTGSASITVLTGTPGVWTGLISTDWFDCRNWEQGLPSLTIDAQIPSLPNNNGNPKRMPVIDRSSTFAALYSGIASARDLIVNPGASVTMVSNNNSELQISRDWRNSGTFIPGTGTVTFNGSAANQIQNINVGIKTNETFYNLTTNNSNGAKGISLVTNFDLTVSNMVTLTSGDIRLTGEAQLVQVGTAINPATGTGNLLIDQQGKKNSFNYNYWSSPVGPGSNLPYTIRSVLRDGTDVTTNPFSPPLINFGSTFDFADLSNVGAIKITDRWIWSYNSQIIEGDDWGNYYKWYPITSSGALKVGEGYTMKGTDGSAPISSTQNYTFIGKPNSGTITLTMIPNNSYLVGNPYPSALDADEFIKDNIKETINSKVGRNTENRFSGALYFWDHFGLSNNHYLAEYKGGYATYSLAGGVVAINDSPLNANDGAKGSNKPQQFIPVGQGFFIDGYLKPSLGEVTTTVIGGPIVFKNSQRAFVRENSGSSIFMKKRGTTKTNSDNRLKIRLGFDSSIGAHRQLLITADSNSTNQLDIGYDAPMFDTNDNDIFWDISNSQFVIQAVPNFNKNQVIPIGIVVANEGEVTLKIDELENITLNTNIYLFDAQTGIYHDLRNSDFKTILAIGEYNKRFSLRFENQTQSLEVFENEINNGIIVFYSNNYKTLIIKNNIKNATVYSVTLFNMIGQKLTNWDVRDREQTNIQIPIKNLPSGIYIVKVKDSNGESSKKIIVN